MNCASMLLFGWHLMPVSAESAPRGSALAVTLDDAAQAWAWALSMHVWIHDQAVELLIYPFSGCFWKKNIYTHFHNLSVDMKMFMLIVFLMKIIVPLQYLIPLISWEKTCLLCFQDIIQHLIENFLIINLTVSAHLTLAILRGAKDPAILHTLTCQLWARKEHLYFSPVHLPCFCHNISQHIIWQKR